MRVPRAPRRTHTHNDGPAARKGRRSGGLQWAQYGRCGKPRRMTPSPVVAANLAVGAGVAIALQAFVNGRLGVSLGSPAYAAVANQVVGITILLVAGVVTGALRRAVERLKTRDGLRWWHVAVSANGAVNITVGAAAAPKVGVALLAVSLVGGQCVGGLVADGLGLTPAGQRGITGARIAGALLALAAVTMAAVGTTARPQLGLLGLAFIAGTGFPLTQAGVGQLTRATGEPIAAGGLSFAVAGVGTLLLAGLLQRHGGVHAALLAVPVVDWLGGVIGAATVIVIALTVRVLGALRLTLSIIAGQAVGGLAIDLVRPVAGAQVTVVTVVSVAALFVAVWVSSGSWIRRSRRGAV